MPPRCKGAWPPALGPDSTPFGSASLNHAMWFHRDVKVDDWWLYVEDSPASQSARGLARGIIFDRDGRLCCSVMPEILLPAPLEA